MREAVLNNGREVSVRLMFRLYSDTLRGPIEKEDARYAVEVSCPRTFVRGTHPALEQDELVLEAGDYDEEILLTPYIDAINAISAFSFATHGHSSGVSMNSISSRSASTASKRSRPSSVR